jgi:hypothetical protein
VITEEELNDLDLHEGDTIEFREDDYPNALHFGPLNRDEHGCFAIGSYVIIPAPQMVPDFPWKATIKVSKRARRPVYVNVDRDPVDGDVARQHETRTRTVLIRAGEMWWAVAGSHIIEMGSTEEKLFLLVDGDTGKPPEPREEPEQPHGMAEDPNRPGYGPFSRSQHP